MRRSLLIFDAEEFISIVKMEKQIGLNECDKITWLIAITHHA